MVKPTEAMDQSQQPSSQRARSKSKPSPGVVVVRSIAALLAISLIVAMCADSERTTYLFARFFAFVARLL
jgi:hypothetical protein